MLTPGLEFPHPAILLQLKSMLFIIESMVNKGGGNNTHAVSIYIHPAHD